MLRAALITRPYEVKVIERDIPEVKENEVLISVRACGICGSDLHIYRGRHPFVKEPRIPGHEFSGIVVEGDEYSKGERVTVEPLIPCGKCELCRRGEYNVCRSLKVLGVHVDGAMAEYVKVPKSRVFKLPKSLGFEEGALVEPLAVAVHVVKRAGIKLGDDVFIIGAGPIGLLILQVAKAVGARRIFISDVIDYRLDVAEKLGADYIINPTRDDVIQTIASLTKYRGIDVTIEVAGARDTLYQALKVTRPHGKVVVVGFFEDEIVGVSATDIVAKELYIVGSRVYWHDFPVALELMSTRTIDVKKIITHKLPLSMAKRAFEIADKKEENALKVLVFPS